MRANETSEQLRLRCRLCISNILLLRNPNFDLFLGALKDVPLLFVVWLVFLFACKAMLHRVGNIVDIYIYIYILATAFLCATLDRRSWVFMLSVFIHFAQLTFCRDPLMSTLERPDRNHQPRQGHLLWPATRFLPIAGKMYIQKKRLLVLKGIDFTTGHIFSSFPRGPQQMEASLRAESGQWHGRPLGVIFRLASQRSI